MSQGRAEALCARIKGANREISEGKAYVGLRSFFFLRRPLEGRTGKIRRDFSRMHRALDGWMLARAPASPTQGLHHHGSRYFNFPYFCTCAALSNLDLLIKTGWSAILSALLLGTLVVGRRQQSESIEVALDME